MTVCNTTSQLRWADVLFFFAAAPLRCDVVGGGWWVVRNDTESDAEREAEPK